MKILNIGTDKSILSPDSALAKRVINYGGLVEKYTVLVPSSQDQEIKLTDNVTVIGTIAHNKAAALWRLYKKAADILSQDEYDLITVQDQYYLALAGWLLARKFKIGLELQNHGFEKCTGLRRKIFEFTIKRAHAVRTVSQRLKKRLVEEFGVPEDRITVAHIFQEVQTKQYEPQVKDKNSKFIFLTVGRLVAVKNIKLQIEAFAELIGNRDDMELWIVGDGPERGRLESFSKKLGISNQVKFLGWQSNPEKYYNQADVFLLTSEAEGWPLVIVEAAAAGLPIIMTNVGSAGELIVDGVSGIIIPVDNKEMLSYAMVKIVRDNALRARLREGALSALGLLPDRKKIMDSYLQSWQKAAGR